MGLNNLWVICGSLCMEVHRSRMVDSEPSYMHVMSVWPFCILTKLSFSGN